MNKTSTTSATRKTQWWAVVPHDPGPVAAGSLSEYVALPPPCRSRNRAVQLGRAWQCSSGGWGVTAQMVPVRYWKVAGPYRTRALARAAQGGQAS